MPTTEEILQAAEKVGQMVADHDATQKLESALKALEKDPDAQQSVQAFNTHLQALAQKEASGQPIEVADKRQLESLQQAVVTNIHLRNFQQAQMDYVDLLRKIDEKIGGQANEALPGGGASGGGAPMGAPGSARAGCSSKGHSGASREQRSGPCESVLRARPGRNGYSAMIARSAG